MMIYLFNLTKLMKVERIKVSVNQITGQHHVIPDLLDDMSTIDTFLQKNKGKRVIVVQGLGFVEGLKLYELNCRIV